MQTDKVLLRPHSKITGTNTPSDMLVKIYLTVQVLPRQNATNLMARSHVSEHQYVNNFFYMYCESFINFGDIRVLRENNEIPILLQLDRHLTLSSFFFRDQRTHDLQGLGFFYILHIVIQN